VVIAVVDPCIGWLNRMALRNLLQLTAFVVGTSLPERRLVEFVKHVLSLSLAAHPSKAYPPPCCSFHSCQKRSNFLRQIPRQFKGSPQPLPDLRLHSVSQRWQPVIRSYTQIFCDGVSRTNGGR
jgi:hypothetical protein